MLTIIARITVDQSRLQQIKNAMLELVADTRQEAGCQSYDLHQDNIVPNRFIFVEHWQDRELWQQHMQGAAIAAFNAKIGDGITDFDIQELSQLS